MEGSALTRFLVHHTVLFDGIKSEIDHSVGRYIEPSP